MALALMLDDLRLLLGTLTVFWIALRLLAADSAPRVQFERLLGDRVDIEALVPLILAGLGGWLAFQYLTRHAQHFKAVIFLRHEMPYQAD